MAKKDPSHRFWELDILRGIAIVLMVVYHALFILYFLYGWEINIASGPLRIIGRVASTTFLLLVGISAYLSYERARQQQLTTEQIAIKFIKRGVRIFMLGVVVSIVSYLLVPLSPVLFGILHLIGVSLMLCLVLLRVSPKWLVAIALLIWVVGWEIKQYQWPFDELVIVGFMPEGFSSLDYFPIFPWFSLVVAGLALGRVGYGGFKRHFAVPNRPESLVITLFESLGKHSLVGSSKSLRNPSWPSSPPYATKS